MNQKPLHEAVIEYEVQYYNEQFKDWQRVGGPWCDSGADNTSAKTTAFEDLRMWREYSATNTYRVIQRVSVTSTVCETCEHPKHRETVGMVCPDCGADYSRSHDVPVPLGEWKIAPPEPVRDVPWPMCADHKEVQHRDRNRPWCNACGWSRGGPALHPQRLGNVR